MSHLRILLKKGWRSDAVWTHPFLFRSTQLRRIPVYADSRALLKSQYWPRDRIEQLQSARLHDVAMHAARIPHWQKYLSPAPQGTGVQALDAVPLTTKNDFFGKPAVEYADVREKQSWFDHTSGSTGKPFRFLHDTHYLLRSLAVCDRMFTTAGRGVRFPVISMRARWRPGVLGPRDQYFYLRGFNSMHGRLPALETLLANYPDGAILQGFSSILLELTRLIEEKHLSLPVRAIVATGEGLSAEQRARIERAFGAQLFMGYTTRELGWLGFECEERNLHLNEEWAYIEIVDSEGNRLRDGAQGRIVVTTFDNRVMPFIRYVTGDIGTIQGTPCSCGRSLKTLCFVGRTAHLIDQGDSATSLLEVAGAFDSFFNAVRHYQIVQTGLRTFLIRVVAGPVFDARRNDIHAALLRVVHPESVITWELVDTIQETAGGKAAYYIRDFT